MIKEIILKTPFIKLDQLLKYAGAVQTGGHAKILIAEGGVKVNGQTCTQRGKKIFSGDRVLVGDDELLIQ